MKRTVYSLVACLLLCELASAQGCTPVNRDERTYSSLEGKVIKILFDSVGNDVLQNERFGAIICRSSTYSIGDYRPAIILGWFRYNADDQCIAVNYFIFPKCENAGDLFHCDYKNPSKFLQPSNDFSQFLQKIVNNGQIAGAGKPKQLKVPLPIGLQDDILLGKMRKIEEPPIFFADDGTPLRTITVSEVADIYCWGFKFDAVELIRTSSNYTDSQPQLGTQIERDILRPIHQTILRCETPEGWRKEVREAQEERSKHYKEELSRRDSAVPNTGAAKAE